ncbi:MAG TPA: aldo/keto reductase, partial [Armatimonadota bacterium]|nr:aldo/keto reductase [Armatimonadota bacterium]
MNSKLTWGIIGTGGIARAFAKGLAGSCTGSLLAVGSRTQASADTFGGEFAIPRRYGSYEALLADSDISAVYIALPHVFHAEWAVKAMEAGKHVLCEKPAALNHAEAMVMVETARRYDVFFMEAFMYRCHPQTAKLIELLRQRVIGDIHVVQASFSFHGGFDLNRRLFNNALGGGGILDVGCYCTSMARLVAGIANGKDYIEPIDVKAVGQIGAESRIDEYAVASAKFPGGILAELSTGVRLNQENVVRIFGSDGSIFLPDPWVPSRNGGTTKIIVQRRGQSAEEIPVHTDMPLYGIEADTVAAYVDQRQAPAMCWDDTLGNMKMLDQWRMAIGMIYDSEKREAQIETITKRPLAVHQDAPMIYGHIDGIDKPMSRLVMGVDNQQFMPHAAVMFDDFFEQGGTCFDTAHLYGGGELERVLGQWMNSRGVRDRVVVLGKGAHTPFCTPEFVTSHINESLERLHSDYIDIFMMHRDNLDVPVGEFIDVLNEHLHAGRIRAFGGSNWSIERVQAANEYARAHGRVGFAAVSDNFSLAQMLDPVWPGCIAVSDAKSRAW